MLKKNEWLWPVALAALALLILLVTGCNTSSALNSHPMKNKGEIIKVDKGENGITILVRIQCSLDNKYYFLKMVGSDTCNVGQIIKLQ